MFHTCGRPGAAGTARRRSTSRACRSRPITGSSCATGRLVTATGSARLTTNTLPAAVSSARTCRCTKSRSRLRATAAARRRPVRVIKELASRYSASGSGWDRAFRWPPGSTSASTPSRSRASSCWKATGKKRSSAPAEALIGACRPGVEVAARGERGVCLRPLMRLAGRRDLRRNIVHEVHRQVDVVAVPAALGRQFPGLGPAGVVPPRRRRSRQAAESWR